MKLRVPVYEKLDIKEKSGVLRGLRHPTAPLKRKQSVSAINN
jgi:hypothetical protein